MVRSLQYWLLLLVAIVAMVATVTMVAADEAAPTITEKVESAKEMSKEKLESTRDMSKEKLESTLDMTKVQGAKLKETMKTWQEWAILQADKWSSKGKDTAGGSSGSAQAYATKGVETLQTSTTQTQESIAGVFSKWSSWAKETAGKYVPSVKAMTNPASEAVNYINKHTPGSSEEEL